MRKIEAARRWPSGVVLMATVVFMLVGPVSARAESRFIYETCDPALPGGNPPATRFQAEHLVGSLGADGNYEPFDTCAVQGGSVGIKQSRQDSAAGFSALETFVPSTPGGWVEAVTMTASAGDFQSGNNGNIQESSTTGYWPTPELGDMQRTFLIRTRPPTGAETGSTTFFTDLFCIYDCEAGAYIASHFIAATEVDPTPPTITAVEGPMVGGGVLRGHQIVRAHATDVGGGVRTMELKINGVPYPRLSANVCAIAAVQNSSYIGIVATSPTPCPPSLLGEWNLDTSAAPFQNGSNTVQVCASDFASIGAPNVTCSNPQTVEVNDTCTESSVPGGTDLSAGFGSNGSDELVVEFGKETEITGDLTDEAGDPIAGATICLQSQPASSSTSPQTVGTATTDSLGRFSMEVRPGANRKLLIGYRHDSLQVDRQLSLETRAHPTIKLNTHEIRGGKRIRISGKLPNPDPGGHVLVLQGSSEHGHTWLTFKKVITGSDGSYSTTYRFTKPRKKTGFRVRVVAPEQAGYEYVTGTSKASRIRVRP